MLFYFFTLFMTLFTAEAAPSARPLDVPFEELYAPPQPADTEEWQVYAGIHASIFYTAQDRGAALDLAQHAAEAIPAIAEQLQLSTGGAIDVYIAPTQEAFFAMQPAIPPDWADGTAWPKSGLVFLRSPTIRDGRSDSLVQVLDHEIVHILLGRAFAHQPVPSWLQEGVAQIAAREYNEQTLDTLAQAGLVDGWIPLAQLSRGFPSNPIRAQLAYAESADFVAYLLQNYGSEALPSLIKHLVQGASFEQAMRITTGKSVLELDQEWRGQDSFEFLWLKPLSSDTTLLALFGLIFVVAAIRKKRDIRKAWELSPEEAQQRAEIQDALDKMLLSWDPYAAKRRPLMIVE